VYLNKQWASHSLTCWLLGSHLIIDWHFVCSRVHLVHFSAPFSSLRKRNITTIIIWNIVCFNKKWASHMFVFIWLVFDDRLAFYMSHLYLVRSVTGWLKGSMSLQLVQPSLFRTSNSLVMRLSEAAFVVCHHKTNVFDVVWGLLQPTSYYLSFCWKQVGYQLFCSSEVLYLCVTVTSKICLYMFR
jgi:hypothetical protein